MRKRRIALTLLLVGMMLTAGGCVAAVIAGAAAAGTVAYTRGDYESIERESVEELHNAVLKALEDLKIAVDSKSMDALGVLFEARTLEGKKINIKIKATENELSKLSIRVGTFGDETMSKIIYNKIKEYLLSFLPPTKSPKSIQVNPAMIFQD